MSSPRVINLRLFLAHAWCRELLPGIAQYAREWGDIELRCTEGLAPLTPDMAKRYTGLIGAFGTDDLTALDSYHDHGIPVVSISEHQVAEGLPVAGHDNYEIGRMAAEHLMAKRIHTFAYVPIESARLNSERHLGFSETVQAAGHKEPSVLLGQQDSDILRNASKPLGVFAFNDLRARHVYDIARGLDLSIPSEVSIIGVDNDPVVCELGSVTLSSVAPNFPGVGYRAAQLLHQLSEGTTQRMEAPRVRPLGLKERLSTNRLLVEDELVRRAITLINKDLKNPLTVTSIAAALGVSPHAVAGALTRGQPGKPAL